MRLDFYLVRLVSLPMVSKSPTFQTMTTVLDKTFDCDYRYCYIKMERGQSGLTNRPTITSLLGRTITQRSSINSDNLFMDDPLAAHHN
jgi:hypothetical protein